MADKPAVPPVDLLAGLPDNMRKELIAEAIRLLVPLADSKQKALAEDLRKIHLPEFGSAGTDKVQVGTYPVAGMLRVKPALDQAGIEAINHLRGWALVGALRFINSYPSQKDQHSRVICGLRTVRNLVAGKYDHNPLESLGTHGNDLSSLQKSFGTLVEHYVERGSSLATQLRHLELVLSDAWAPRSPRYVGSMSRSAGDEEAEILHKTIELPDADLIMETDDPVGPDTSPEEIDESYKPAYYLLQPRPDARMQGTDREAQMSLLIEMESASTSWRADFASLTAQEARTVFAAALNDARRGNRAAKLVLAMLVSGRSLQILLTAGHKPVRGTTWIDPTGGICFAPDVTGSDDAEAGGFALRPPEDLHDWCDPWPDTETAEQAVAQWIAGLGTDRTVRLSRITRALRDGLFTRGTDSAIAGLLCGVPCSQLVQLHYARVSIKRLDSAWRETLDAHFGAPDGFRVKAIAPGVTAVGSVLAPPRAHVAIWFKELVASAREARKAEPNYLDTYVQRVAAETNLACSVLEFQCARRPLNDAFEPLGQIVGLRRPQVRLTGKGSRQVDDGRWVPLCAASQRVLAMWRQTLEELLRWGVCVGNRSLGVMIGTILAGEACPFFEWTHIDAEPIALSAVQLHLRTGAPELDRNPARAKGQTHTRDNWARHFMRNALMQADVPGRVIDGFFAHGGATGDPMAPASGAAVADADALRVAIDGIWDGLGVDLSEVAP